MESLFNYESDEDSQEKGTDELDANYDHVAMDMSSDDEGKPSQLENKTCLSTTVESSELSCPNYISCSSDESHGLATTNTTRSQSLMDENNTSRKRKSKMKEEEEEGRLSPCSSTSSNSKKSRYHSSHGIGDVKSMENRYNSTNIARHQHNESARFDAKASHQGSSTKYTHSHSRRYSREWDGEKRYRPRSGDSPSCNDERSESRTSVQNSPVQKFIGDHPSQMRESSRDLKIPNNCNRMAANPSRYADQVQKRKLLWSGENKGTGCDSKAESKSNHWQDAKFSQDTDGRLRAKFKRLMGMKATEAEAQVGNAPSASSNDLIKKQEEMFNSMEMQYEVARVSTHTHRGLGLGFGVHQFPR